MSSHSTSAQSHPQAITAQLDAELQAAMAAVAARESERRGARARVRQLSVNRDGRLGKVLGRIRVRSMSAAVALRRNAEYGGKVTDRGDHVSAMGPTAHGGVKNTLGRSHGHSAEMVHCSLPECKLAKLGKRGQALKTLNYHGHIHLGPPCRGGQEAAVKSANPLLAAQERCG